MASRCWESRLPIACNIWFPGLFFDTISAVTNEPSSLTPATPLPTPMIHIWLVVLGSMLFVALAGFVWHFTTMMRLDTTQIAERNEVTARNAKLEAYIAAQGTTSIPTVDPTLPL